MSRLTRWAIRLCASFAIGSSERFMGAELSRQGFLGEDWDSSTEKEHEALRRENDFVCNRAARIYWRADGEGRPTAIRGLYREEECF
jgi:hypothetical protein